MKKCINLTFAIMLVTVTLFGKGETTQYSDDTSLPSYNQFEHDTRTAPKGYVSLAFNTGFPAKSFAHQYDRTALFGFGMDAGILPNPEQPIFQPGIYLDILLAGKQKHTWKGIEVDTERMLVHIGLFNRFQLTKGNQLDPFVELFGGMHISTTHTNYEVVDKATFLEEFLFNQEDEIETVSVKRHNQYGSNLGIAIGTYINHIGVIKIKYHYGPNIEFINKDDVRVEGNELTYEATSSQLHAITLSLGIAIRDRW